MTEDKRGVNYKELWEAAKREIAELKSINPESVVAGLDIDDIEKVCSGDPEKCWQEYKARLIALLAREQ